MTSFFLLKNTVQFVQLDTVNIQMSIKVWPLRGESIEKGITLRLKPYKKEVIGKNLFLSCPDWPIPLSWSASLSCLPACLFYMKCFASHPARAWHSCMSCPSVLPLMPHLSTCMLTWRQSIPPAFPACLNIGYLSVCLSCLSLLSANYAWLQYCLPVLPVPRLFCSLLPVQQSIWPVCPILSPSFLNTRTFLKNSI